MRKFTADLREFTADEREFTRNGRNSRGCAEMFSSSAVEHVTSEENSPQVRGILSVVARFIANTTEMKGPLLIREERGTKTFFHRRTYA